MKVIQVIPQIIEGGAERFVVDLSNALVEFCNCQVILIVFFNIDRNHILIKDLNSNVQVITLNKKLGLDLSIIIKLHRLVKELKPDIIHTHLYAFEYMIWNSIYFKNKIKFINTLHSSPTRMYKKKITKFVGVLLYRFIGVSAVIISSDSISEFNQLFSKVQPSVIFNGRPKVSISQRFNLVFKEIESLKKTPDTKVFINLAKVSPVKNQLMLVAAINTLIDEGEDIMLIIIGTLWDNEIVKAIRNKSSNNIHLLGYKENPTDYLACSNAFCLTSLNEGMPISLIESIQQGVIPICTPAGGVKDIIKPSFGFISSSFSTPSYIKSLKSFLKLDNTKLKDMSKKAKLEYENNYTMKNNALKYYHLYNK